MNKFLPIIFLLAFCFACKFISFENKNSQESPKITPSVNAPIKAETPIKKESTPQTESPLVLLKKMKDKTASEIKFFSNQVVSQRLEKLMGKDYQTMKKFWNVETPIELEENILRLTGCEAHNCGSNYYVIFLDTKKDNINVHHILEDSLKTYNEKGEIVLPKKFAEEFKEDTYNVNK